MIHKIKTKKEYENALEKIMSVPFDKKFSEEIMNLILAVELYEREHFDNPPKEN